MLDLFPVCITILPQVILFSLLAVATADVLYDSGASHGSSFPLGSVAFGEDLGRGLGGGSSSGGGSCGGGQVRHFDGSCVTPQVTRNLYVYRAPAVAPIVGPRPNVPGPRLEHNLVFIHTPEGLAGQDAVVVPPPQQKNVVYLLSKRPTHDQQLIHVPAPEQQAPEIFFVNYADGENPSLPTGGDLRSALSEASQGSGELVSGGNTTNGLYGVPSPPAVLPPMRLYRHFFD